MYNEHMGFLRLQNKGQAVVEYLLIVAFLVIISSKLALNFTDFMRDSIGNLGHVLSLNLSVGVCEKQCYFGAYSNGSNQ